MERLFVALNLSISVVEGLVRLQEDLTREIDERFGDELWMRPVAPQNIHVTLKFLGDTPPALIPRIRQVLRTLCEPLFAFRVECLGVGVFPDAQKPRIVWAGLDEQGAEVLGLLQKNVERDLGAIGVPQEQRPYRPHVTVGRIKAQRRRSFEELLTRYDGVSFGESVIGDMVLFRSELRSQGPRYEVVERFRLGQG